MFDPDPPFRPVRRCDGYVALEDTGLIGDGTTSALVGLDGSVVWLCLPRFDSEPLFCGLLDHARGGAFTVAPDEVVEARQHYEPDTAVLITELRSPTGLVAVTDALALRPGTDLSDDAPAGRRELIRSAVVLDGSVRLRVELEPRGGALAHTAAGGLSVEARGRQDLDLHIRCNRPLESLRSVHQLRAGDRLDVALSWGGAYRHHRFSEEELLAATARSWRRWMESFHDEGPEATLVRRAALTLKLCDYWSNLLRFGLNPEGLTLELTGTGPGVALSLVPLTLSAEMEPPELPAYGRILLDVLRNDATLSIRADEAEEAWRVVTPILDGWSRNVALLEEYDAGSNGPSEPRRSLP